MRTLKVLAIISLLIASITNTHADKIRIILHQPPPNQMGIGDMWNLELNNTTDKDMRIFLTGTATEEKDGLIIEGKSKVFTIKPGRSNYKYNDFSGAEVKYNNGKYKEIILRTGNAPEGSYTICVTAFEESGEIAGQENCIMQTVQQLGSITLISPEENAEIDPDTLPGIAFVWTGIGVTGPYTLKIIELKGSEVPPDPIAFKEIRPYFEQKGIKGNSFQYPVTVPKFEAGKKYAWQISSGDVVSEPFIILIPMSGPVITLVSPSNGKEIDPDSLSGLMFSWRECPKCPPMYTLRIVEIKGSQSPEEAFRTNQPIFEKELKSTTYKGDPIHGVDVKLGMKLAWQVTSGDVVSEPYVIVIPMQIPDISLSDVKVELQKNGKTLYESKTNEKGEFKISGVSNGEYGLKISKDGFPPPDRFLLSFGPGGIIICCCPGPPCDDPVVLIIGDEKTTKINALFFEGGEISAKIVPFPPVGPQIPHR